MNKVYLCVTATTLLASTVLFGRQELPYQTLPPEQQAMRDAHTKAATPGPQHIDLMRFAGEFSTKESYYLPGIKEALVTDGYASIKSEMGGRFLVEHNNGAYLGEPYMGVRIYGYNNGSKQYEGVWTSSGSTSVKSLTGTSGDGGKSIDFTGSFKDDESGQARTISVTMRLLDPDHFEVESKSTMPDGSAGPRVVSVYARKL